MQSAARHRPMHDFVFSVWFVMCTCTRMLLSVCHRSRMSASHAAAAASAGGEGRGGVLRSCCCTTLLNSPARKLERRVGVTMHPLMAPPLFADPCSTRAGVLGASCMVTAAAAAGVVAVAVAAASSKDCARRCEAWPKRVAAVAGGVHPAAAAASACLLADASEMVSTANRRCHSLSPSRSRLMARGLSAETA